MVLREWGVGTQPEICCEPEVKMLMSTACPCVPLRVVARKCPLQAHHGSHTFQNRATGRGRRRYSGEAHLSLGDVRSRDNPLSLLQHVPSSFKLHVRHILLTSDTLK